RCVLMRENLRQVRNPENRVGKRGPEKGSNLAPAETAADPFSEPLRSGCRARLVIWYNFFRPLPTEGPHEPTSDPMPDFADARPSRRLTGPGEPGERPVPRAERKPARRAARAAQRRTREVRLGSLASQI